VDEHLVNLQKALDSIASMIKKKKKKETAVRKMKSRKNKALQVIVV
jgi:hypothetical protein